MSSAPSTSGSASTPTASEETSVLPAGWRERLIRYSNSNTNGVTGWCLERHDLCVAKLVADRSKDREFVAALRRAGMVDPDSIIDHLDTAAISNSQRQRIASFIRAHGHQDDGGWVGQDP